jgi:predicted ATP-grasp superfamily ATP-dependent carboligase
MNFSLDVSVPALIMKLGRYPVHHGGVGAIRTLGRMGVPVYAVTEDRYTPAATSRYLRGSFVWPTSAAEDPGELVERLTGIGRSIGRRTLLLPTDEEAAILVAEHADELAPHFLTPPTPHGLTRRLASKKGLHELCLQHGVPIPATAFPADTAEVERFAATARFPVVAKNRDAFTRRTSPAVHGTTRVDHPEGLLALAAGWSRTPNVALQEYLPPEHTQDWIVHLHIGSDADSTVLFTGVKVRSWPPQAGMTACAYVVGNAELAGMSADLCRKIGFRGIGDLDWRFDRRDQQYKLLDFNPRIGAQFRLFETTDHIDVVRSLHLDMTGRRVPRGPQVEGRRLIVENIDIPARIAYHLHRSPAPKPPEQSNGTEYGWWAPDDPRPFFVMLARLVRPGVSHLVRVWRGRRRAQGKAKR